MKSRIFKMADVVSGVVISGAAAASVAGTQIYNNKRAAQKSQQAGAMPNQAKMDINIESPEGGIAKAYKFKM
jgi:hypothetical protein